MSSRLSVGIDEAGRGCVLGPLVVAVVAASETDRRHFARWNVRDSKLVPPAQRDHLAARIKERCWHEVRVALPPAIDIAVADRSRTLNGLELEMMADLLRTFRTQHTDHDAWALVDAPSINAKAFRDKLHVASGWDNPDRLHAKHHADRDNRTVGAASIIAKAERERLLALIKDELGLDIGCGYPHDAKTIAYIKTAPRGAVHVRWSWKTAAR